MKPASIEFDPALVEEAVYLAVRGDATLEADFHAHIDPLYRIEDPHEKDAAFAWLMGEWFRKLDLARGIRGLIAERPRIARLVDRCLIRKAPRSKAQNAELFVREQQPRSDEATKPRREQAPGTGHPPPDQCPMPNARCPMPESPIDNHQSTIDNRHSAIDNSRRTLLVQILPERLVDPAPVVAHFRRELLHIDDILDEEFGYDPQAFVECSASARKAGASTCPTIDRYRVLWDVYVENRLRAAGLVSSADQPRLRYAFDRVFAGSAPDERDAAFEWLLKLQQTTHRELLYWAKTARLPCPRSHNLMVTGQLSEHRTLAQT